MDKEVKPFNLKVGDRFEEFENKGVSGVDIISEGDYRYMQMWELNHSKFIIIQEPVGRVLYIGDSKQATIDYYHKHLYKVTAPAEGEDKYEIDLLKNHYTELMSFKDDPEFHKYGLEANAETRAWEQQSEWLQIIDKQAVEQYGVSCNVLSSLAFKYTGSKGKNNRDTLMNRWNIERAFAMEE